MILLCCCGRQMIKRPTIAACNGRFRKRKNSAIRTLVAETLVLAKTHGYVEKIESELEAELARDFSDPPEDRILRWRRKGDTIFKSKHVLLTVVILCVLDCALVLGELALDLYKVKATLAKTDALNEATYTFVNMMARLHPQLDSGSPYEMFTALLNSVFIWTDDANNTHLAGTPSGVQCSNGSTLDIAGYRNGSGGGDDNGTVMLTMPGYSSQNHVQDEHDLEIVGKIAHVFHYLSIAILLIIMLETILKAICAGRAFFHRKIEVFDASIVLLSFCVDFCFLAFLPTIDTKDFVFVLAILLPWRVIRVVNSLVVSVKDHEHFRLKLVYKRKKKIQGNLRDTEAMLQKYMSQVTTLQRLCIMEGIDEWKVDNYLKNEENTQPVTPSKRKFKFKFDDSGVQTHTRSSRCSMPSLDFHGVRLPSTVHVSRSRISLPAVANSIKNTLSKTLPSRRASMAAIEMFGTKMTNGDVRKKKVTSEDLGTMEEEDIDDLDNHDSALSSRATSESGDVFSRLSVSDSIGSDRLFTDILGNTKSGGGVRRDSVQTVGEKDERDKLAKIKEEAKRRHSESTIDKRRVSLTGLTEGVSCTMQSGKTYTKPQTDTSTSFYIDNSPVELHSVDQVKDDSNDSETEVKMKTKDDANKEGDNELVIDTKEDKDDVAVNTDKSPTRGTCTDIRCNDVRAIDHDANRPNVESVTSETVNEDPNISKQEVNTISKEEANDINKEKANTISKGEADTISEEEANNISKEEANTICKGQTNNVNKGQANNFSNEKVNTVNKQEGVDDSVIVQIDKAIQNPNTDAAKVSDSVTLMVGEEEVQLSDNNTTSRETADDTGSAAPESVIDMRDV